MSVSLITDGLYRGEQLFAEIVGTFLGKIISLTSKVNAILRFGLSKSHDNKMFCKVSKVKLKN